MAGRKRARDGDGVEAPRKVSIEELGDLVPRHLTTSRETARTILLAVL